MTADLRDRRALTGLLVLRELAFAPGSTLRAVADRLGVTVQAVSVHAQRLAEEGLLLKSEDGYGLTARGTQALHEGFGDLKRTIDETIARMAVVRVTSAVAGGPLRAGETVGLFMEKGELVAHARRRSPSTGVAVHGADAGEEVQVRDLAGVVELRPGRMLVLRVPSPEEGGSRRVALRRLKALVREKAFVPDRVGAVGTSARVLARRAGFAPDLEFAPVEAGFHAAELGFAVLLFVTRENLKDSLATIDARNARTLERVLVEILDCPEAAGGDA